MDLKQADPELLRAARRLAETVTELKPKSKTQPRAFFVGGFVRDLLLGLHPKDADMEVFGVEPKRLEALLEKLFPRRVNPVGRTFGILKIHLKNGHDLDVSVPRRESKKGRGHKGFLIESDPTLSFEEASKRRDFTVNSILLDPLTEDIIDPFDGQKDLKKKVLRVTDPKRFQDDPLRVYRGIQFAARLGMKIEPKSLELMREMVARGDLDELSSERVTDELKKLLLAERPSVGFELMRELGIIERSYPELQALIGTPQEPEWHPEGDVWIHTMMVVDEAAHIVRQPERGFNEEEKLAVVLSALVHDLGKPSTTRLGEKHGQPRIRSIGHEEAGEEPTRQLFKRLSFSSTLLEAAIVSTTQHLKPGMLYYAKEKGQLTDESYANAVRKLLKRIHPVSWKILIAGSEADYRGRTLPESHEPPYPAGDLFVSTIKRLGFDQAASKPLITGSDVLKRGIKPGPDVGRTIRDVEALRDEGKIKTRKEALAYLKKLLP